MTRPRWQARRCLLRIGLLGLISTWLMAFTFVSDTPEDQGMSTPHLDDLSAYSDQFGVKSGLLVMRNDRVVLERYRNGANSLTLFDIKSATKSFGAGLLVKALQDNDLSLDHLVCTTPDFTVWQVATMSSGIQKANSSCNGPYWFPAGTDFGYTDSGANVLRDKIRTLYGSNLEPKLASALMNPIGAQNWSWDSSQNFSSGLDMSVRDMTRYGRLWLRGGDWDGVQVLDANLVAQATSPSNPSLKPDYGMLWWLQTPEPPPFYDRYGFKLNPVFPDFAPSDSFLAAGCTRSWILVVPSLELVAARSGGACVSIQNGSTQFTDEVRAFVELVLSAVTECSDGIDNDGDGSIDYPDDAGCNDLADQDELPMPEPSGPLALLPALGLLAALGRRRRASTR